MLMEAYRIRRELGERGEVVDILSRLAAVLAEAGKPGTATRLLSSSEALREEIGATFQPWDTERFEKTLATIHAQLDEARFAEAWEQGRTLTADEAVALALKSKGAR